MKRRNPVIKNLLLLFFLFNLVICPTFHECHELAEAELIQHSPAFENHHHEDLMANGENKSPHVMFSDTSFTSILPLTTNLFQQDSCQSIPSLISEKTNVLRC